MKVALPWVKLASGVKVTSVPVWVTVPSPPVGWVTPVTARVWLDRVGMFASVSLPSTGTVTGLPGVVEDASSMASGAVFGIVTVTSAVAVPPRPSSTT